MIIEKNRNYGAGTSSGSTRQKESHHIMVVDDDLFLLEMIKKVLSKEGFKVTTAKDGNEAARLIPQVKPDLLLLDVMLPSITGLELLNNIRIQQFNSKLPVIFISGLTDKTFIASSLFQGVNAYFTKPLDYSSLIARIKSLVKGF